MDEYIAQTFVGLNVFNTILGGFGCMALLLASIGTYGVLSYSVAQRRRELGVRMAIGAKPSAVVRMVAGQGLRLGVIGLGIGALLTLPLVGVLNGLLQGLSTVRPFTLVFIGAILFGTTLLASWLPASRASRIDPVRTLREE
jgi:ABC-type antimicrobial peptide transport system permease subunit